jgi:hypothetical protein
MVFKVLDDIYAFECKRFHNTPHSNIFLNSLLAIRITLDSMSSFAVILYDVKRLIQK